MAAAIIPAVAAAAPFLIKAGKDIYGASKVLATGEMDPAGRYNFQDIGDAFEFIEREYVPDFLQAITGVNAAFGNVDTSAQTKQLIKESQQLRADAKRFKTNSSPSYFSARPDYGNDYYVSSRAIEANYGLKPGPNTPGPRRWS